MIKLKNILAERSIPTAKNSLHALELQINEIAAGVGEQVERRLGAAANGVAFKTKSGKVLKITGDDQEVAAAIRLRNRFARPLKHVATAYGVHQLHGFKYKNSLNQTVEAYDYYLLILPFVNVLTDEEGRLWDEVYHEFFQSRWSNDHILNYIKSFNHLSPPQLDILLALIKRLLPQRASIINDFNRANIKPIEAHGGNVGFDDYGTFMHYDYWIMNPNGGRWYHDTSKTNMDVHGPNYTTDGIDTPNNPDM